jgi:hypothetical protein
MKKLIALLFFLVCYNQSGIAIENPRAGARALALSDAFISFSDTWSTFHNQAGLASLSSVSGAVFYSSKFGLKELSQMAGSVVLPTKTGVFGFGYSQFGTGQFKETKLGITFAKKLAAGISAGMQIDYLSSLFPENNRAKGFVTFEGGILYEASEKMTLGVHVFNPLYLGIETLTGKVKMPISFRTGANYRFSEFLLMCFELEKDSGNGLIFKIGTEFLPVRNLAIRFGFSGKPFAYTAGIGYQFGKISTDIGFSYFGNLGFAPSVSIQYDLK